MRKTKTIYNTIKTLCLVFAVCFLATTQSIGQSNLESYNSPSLEIQKHNTIDKFTIQSVFDWFRTIVTTDMSVFITGKFEKASTLTESERRGIVTTDMSVRDGNKED